MQQLSSTPDLQPRQLAVRVSQAMGKLIKSIRAFFYSSNSWPVRILVLLTVVVFIAGFTGLMIKNWHLVHKTGESVPDPALVLKVTLDSLLQSFQLFLLGLDLQPGRDNWLLTLARPAGAVVFFAALIRLAAEVFQRNLQLARTARMQNHTVVIGFGSHGRHFARSSRRHGPVAVMDIRPAEDFRQRRLRDRQGGYIQGNGLHKQSLDLANIAHARKVIISTGSDAQNLAILKAVAEFPPADKDILRQVAVTIKDTRLADILSRQDVIAGPQAETGILETKIFNPARAAARQLLQRTQFVELALAMKHERVRLVIIGQARVADEVMLQFLRISPCNGLKKPLVERIVTNRNEAIGRLAARTPAFLSELEEALASKGKGVLNWAADCKFHSFESTGGSHELLVELLKTTSSDPVTAFVVAFDNAAHSLEVALSLREVSSRLDLPAGPVYVHTPLSASLDPLFARLGPPLGRKPGPGIMDLRQESNPAKVLEPFGQLEDICDADEFGGIWEKIARRLHETYRQYTFSKKPELRQISETRLPDNMQPWSRLKQTYRQSNHRSAAHFPVKLVSAGVAVNDMSHPPAIPASVMCDANRLETLAALEHDSWRIDRELDGWRYGATRDNTRRMHPDLVPYESLSEDIKNYDREQIRLLGMINIGNLN